MIARRVETTWAVLAVLVTVGASHVLYYVFVAPAMTHGLVFGVVAALLWAAERAQRAPTRRAFWLLGFLTGLSALVRQQTAVCGVLLLLVAADGLRRRTVPARWILEAGACGLLAVAPQLIVWKVVYGSWLLVPQGDAFFVSAGARAWDVLLHADRGFFVWTPLMALATVGLVAGWRRWGLFSAAGLAVLALTAFVNGSLWDWPGSDSFGSRRFDVAVPFLALGMATLLQWQARHPAVLPSLGCALAIAWNLGLISLYREHAVNEAAPLERIAGFQGRRLRRTLEDAAHAVGGPRLRGLVYKVMVGEYFYWNLNRSGTIDLSTPDERHLAGGWSEPRWEGNRPRFRWALPPRACIRIPLEQPMDLRTTLRARAPGRLAEPQVVTVEVNGAPVASLTVPEDWTDLQVVLPARALGPGENAVCLAFALAAPTDDGREVSALVARIQLP
jgi:hypothetical protein